MKKWSLSIVLAFIFLSASILFGRTSLVSASEWQIVGPRALGMGGANVAVANDATATYWNPAAFGFFDVADDSPDDYGKRGWSTTTGLGIGVQISGNLGEEINKISDIDFEGLTDINGVASTKISDFIQLVDELKVFQEKDRSVTITTDPRLGFQVGHFGFGAYVFGNISATPVLDLNNIAPVPDGTNTILSNNFIDQFTNPSNLGCTAPCTTVTGGLSTDQENELITRLTALPNWDNTQASDFVAAIDQGLAGPSGTGTASDENFSQIVSVATLASNAVSGGGGPLSKNESVVQFKGIVLAEIPLTYGQAIRENLSIGGNIKYMKARVYDIPVKLFDSDFGDALETALDDYEEKSNFGIDLGLLYRMGKLNVGIVGRNLNAPKFGSLRENPQLRTGIAYKPLTFVTLAADMDLTKNDATSGSKLKSQNVGAGLEVNIFKILQLRGGLYKNLAENDIGLVYTAGIGLNLWVVNLDIGAAISKDKTDIDGTDVPEEVKAEFALSMLF